MCSVYDFIRDVPIFIRLSSEFYFPRVFPLISRADAEARFSGMYVPTTNNANMLQSTLSPSINLPMQTIKQESKISNPTKSESSSNDTPSSDVPQPNTTLRQPLGDSGSSDLTTPPGTTADSLQHKKDESATPKHETTTPLTGPANALDLLCRSTAALSKTTQKTTKKLKAKASNGAAKRRTELAEIVAPVAPLLSAVNDDIVMGDILAPESSNSSKRPRDGNSTRRLNGDVFAAFCLSAVEFETQYVKRLKSIVRKDEQTGEYMSEDIIVYTNKSTGIEISKEEFVQLRAKAASRPADENIQPAPPQNSLNEGKNKPSASIKNSNSAAQSSSALMASFFIKSQ